jgi:hypothetical protein
VDLPAGACFHDRGVIVGAGERRDGFGLRSIEHGSQVGE